MIPNVGNMSFYMSTMICDFASEILDQFATIVCISFTINTNNFINFLLNRLDVLKV